MDEILQEQLAYYRARALEYDESLQGRRRVLGDRADTQIRDEIARARDALRRCAKAGPGGHLREQALCRLL